MKHLSGASMPRSGHHLLHRLLSDYFSDSFGYCSFYYPWEFDSFKSCCGSIPCQKAQSANFEVFFQKSHDFELTDPVDDSTFKIVQVREPIPRLFSNFKLHVKHNPERYTFANFMNFASREYYYYVAFWMKWVRPEHYVLTYERLTENPVAELEQLVVALGLTPDRSRIEKVTDAQVKVAGVDRAAFRPSRFREHEFYDEQWAKKYAQNVAAACFGYDAFLGEP